MNYTTTFLFALGILGILLHNLVELNKLNKASKGTLNIRQYLKLEAFSIAISVIVIIVALIVREEVKQLDIVGKWLGLAFMAIGYMGQSLLVFVMRKANKVIDKEEPKKDEPTV